MKTRSPLLTIIILNFNGSKDTCRCIKSVFKSSFSNFQLVIVDNGSTKNELTRLQTQFNDRRIVWRRFEKNLGFAGGNNFIIKETRTPYIMLLNNDAVIEPNCLKNLVKIMVSSPKIAACQAKILCLKRPKYFDYSGAAGGKMDQFGYPFVRGRLGVYQEEDLGQYDNEKELFWASGAAIMFRRKICLKVGLLPNDFFFYHEETDLCWRLKDAGYRIVFVPQSIIFHKGGGSSMGSTGKLARRIFYVHRNALLLISRNLPVRKLVWVLPLRIILDWMSIIYYIAIGKWWFMLPVFLAHVSFGFHITNLIWYRRARNIPFGLAENAIEPFSIYWKYFARGQRRYCEITGESLNSKIKLYS